MSRTRRVDDEVSKSMIYNQEDMSVNLGSVESTFLFLKRCMSLNSQSRNGAGGFLGLAASYISDLLGHQYTCLKKWSGMQSKKSLDIYFGLDRCMRGHTHTDAHPPHVCTSIHIHMLTHMYVHTYGHASTHTKIHKDIINNRHVSIFKKSK